MRYGSKNRDLIDLAKQSRLNPSCGGREERIFNAVRRVYGRGRVFHVLADTPSQNEDYFSVLIDDQLVLDFELERNADDATPVEVKLQSVAQFRNEVGQKGVHRLEATLELAREAIVEAD